MTHGDAKKAKKLGSRMKHGGDNMIPIKGLMNIEKRRFLNIKRAEAVVVVMQEVEAPADIDRFLL